MCNVCCKELRGWCKSFTQTETLLVLLEGVLLIVFIAFLVFVILHLLACHANSLKDYTQNTYTPNTYTANTRTENSYKPITSTPNTYTNRTNSTTSATETVSTAEASSQSHQTITPIPKPRPTIACGKCTWNMSHQTPALTHYYEQTTHTGRTSTLQEGIRFTVPILEEQQEYDYGTDYESDKSDSNTDSYPDDGGLSDGEDAEDIYKRLVLALVKMNPPTDVTFGCVVTIVSEYWVVTAASCVDAAEEVDALESFVLVEGYGEMRFGRAHAVADVRVHPLYAARAPGLTVHDVAVLRSEDSLTLGGVAAALPSALDHLLLTIGERLILLGYGPFRTVDRGPLGRRLRQTVVFRLGGRQCGGGGGPWARRHLWRGRGGEGAGVRCAGVLHARGLPCTRCAGAPVFAAPPAPAPPGPAPPVLAGVSGGEAPCGAACEPWQYASLAELRDWLDDILQ